MRPKNASAVSQNKRFDSHFRGKQILVTGGTGSFGHEIVAQLLCFDPARIVIFSRDEKKQSDMRDEFDNNPRLVFTIGDIRDYPTLLEAMEGIEIVYHAAALKQVPTAEFNPYEAAKTNIVGTEHVRKAALTIGAEVVVLISTDKAVKPVNVMGMTKALAEKIILCPIDEKRWKTRLVCVRYGNVIGSRGSVIPIFRDRIAAGRPLPITDSKMTRFLLTLPEAVDLVFKSTIEADTGFVYVKKMPACYIGDLASAMSTTITGRTDYPLEHVGVRPGEKLHEILVSEEEMRRAQEKETYFLIPPANRSGYPSFDGPFREYASNNACLLDQPGIIRLLRSEGWL